jgi:hypothetical protein
MNVACLIRDAASRHPAAAAVQGAPWRWITGKVLREARDTCFAAHRPLRLARFWGGVLGWEMTDGPQGGVALLPGDDTGFRIRLPASSAIHSSAPGHFPS